MTLPTMGTPQGTEERDRLARDRTTLARERTMAAWIRTGLAAMAAGFVIAKLAEGFEPRWASAALGGVLTLVGMAMLSLALWTSRLTHTSSAPKAQTLPFWAIAVLVGLIDLCALGAVLLLILGV